MIRCLFRFSSDAGTSSCLWSFNPLFLRLLGKISLSLLCSYSSRDSALDLDPPLHVGRLRASVPRPDRTGLQEQLHRGLWLTQARREGGARMRVEPAAAEAGLMLQQPEAHRALSRGSCPRITGAWQWQAAEAPGRGGVESDLCSHTGLLVAAAAAPASPACLWGPRCQPRLAPASGVRTDSRSSCPPMGSALIAAAHARLWSSFRWRSEFPLLARRKTKTQEKVSCLFGSCRLFPGLPPS